MMRIAGLAVGAGRGIGPAVRAVTVLQACSAGNRAGAFAPSAASAPPAITVPVDAVGAVGRRRRPPPVDLLVRRPVLRHADRPKADEGLHLVLLAPHRLRQMRGAQPVGIERVVPQRRLVHQPPQQAVEQAEATRVAMLDDFCAQLDEGGWHGDAWRCSAVVVAVPSGHRLSAAGSSLRSLRAGAGILPVADSLHDSDSDSDSDSLARSGSPASGSAARHPTSTDADIIGAA